MNKSISRTVKKSRNTNDVSGSEYSARVCSRNTFDHTSAQKQRQNNKSINIWSAQNPCLDKNKHIKLADRAALISTGKFPNYLPESQRNEKKTNYYDKLIKTN